jgi:antitoxin component of RelBE/YafQ-DinJ toxin-antitoxin module
MLPESIKQEAEQHARRAGISFSELVRSSLARAIAEPATPTEARRRQAAIEQMLRFSEGAPAGPADLSTNLDDYLYGPVTAKGRP